MNTHKASELKKYLNTIKGNPHVRGVEDCNLMILYIHHPEFYEKLHKRYSTIIGGVRQANKLIGYNSVRQILQDSGDYIITKHPVTGDVLAMNDSHDVYVVIGTNLFGVIGTEDCQYFGTKPLTALRNDNFKFYHNIRE